MNTQHDHATSAASTATPGLIQSLRGSAFLRNNAIVFIGSIATGALNYLYYPILGRLLDPSPFGEVQTLVSLFVQIVIFLSVLGLLTVNIVANQDNSPQAQRTVFELEKLALAISGVMLLASVLLAPILQRFFNFESSLPFIILALSVVVSVPATFRMAYLRGKQLFGLNSIASIIGAAAKLALSALFIVIGWGTTGAILGLVVAQLISFVYSAVRARQHGFGPSLKQDFWRMPDLKILVPELRYAGLVLVGSLAVTAFYSIDIIAVKHWFDGHTAGLYAGIATVARIIFFLTGSVAMALMPSIKLNSPAHENRQILLKSLYLLVAIGGAALLIFAIAPNLVIKLLMGHEYLPYANLLGRLSLVIFIVSLLNLFITYYMALRRYAIALIAIIGLAVTCGLVGIHHDSLRAVVDSMLYGTGVTGIILAAWAGMSMNRNASKLKGNES